jgi:phosphate transport system substrate-binding protein
MLRNTHVRIASAAVAFVMAATTVVPAFAGTLKVTGSTTLQPLATQWAAAFHKSHSSITVNVYGGGSGTGIKDAGSGTADIGMSSRELTQAEKDSGLVPFEVARDAVVVVVNPANKYRISGRATIEKIFRGQITNWRQLGSAMPNKAIVLVGRTGASGTYAFFKEKFLRNLYKQSSRAKTYASNGLVRSAVARDKYAIGYISMAYVNSSVKALKIDGHVPNKANALSGAYPYVRGLYFVTKGTRSGDAKTFMDWCLTSAAQKIAGAEYLPLH